MQSRERHEPKDSFSRSQGSNTLSCLLVAARMGHLSFSGCQSFSFLSSPRVMCLFIFIFFVVVLMIVYCGVLMLYSFVIQIIS